LTNILETERLKLRPLTLADADTAYKWTGESAKLKCLSLPAASFFRTVFIPRRAAKRSLPLSSRPTAYVAAFMLRYYPSALSRE